jgi:hypothetical protein
MLRQKRAAAVAAHEAYVLQDRLTSAIDRHRMLRKPHYYHSNVQGAKNVVIRNSKSASDL